MDGAVEDTLLSASSIRGFSASLYMEHLEELSFLYERSKYQTDDPEFFWHDHFDIEKRSSDHIYGLITGGDLAVQVCRHQIKECDYSGIYPSIRIFCHQNRPTLVEDVLEELDYDDDKI